MLTEKGKILQDMFEMVSFHTDTGRKPLSPLIDGPVDDCLSKVWPYINQALLQLIDVACVLLINMGLEEAPNSAIVRIYVGAIRWPDVGRN